ncbi:MAG: nucleotidyltransferase substrate binding protein [Candidatus Kapabacteria bacterium]|nr:nucleotidyltransferase substrate binding protein [Candidatus Kapabacteria bacterium]
MELKLKQYEKAVKGFAELVEVDLKELKNRVDNKIIDGILNGQAQKFEYTTELCWKILRKYLIDFEGLVANSPKSVIKTCFNIELINEKIYLNLIDIINDRNKLSHIYKENEFKKITRKFKKYSEVFLKVLEILKKKVTNKN